MLEDQFSKILQLIIKFKSCSDFLGQRGIYILLERKLQESHF